MTGVTAAGAPAGREVLTGVAWGLVAVLIWAGWVVFTALGVETALTPYDVSLLRVGIPTLLLLPLLVRERATVRAVGPAKGLLLACYGLPFTLLVGIGFHYAPAAHAAALIPGIMPIFAAVLGFFVLRERFGRRRLLGFAAILVAAALIFLDSETAAGPGAIRGDLIFLLAALCWAVFTVTARPLGLSPYLATALVGLYSSLILVPFYVALDLGRLDEVPTGDLIFQIVYQGFLSGFVSIWAYARAIKALGASPAAAFSALVPPVATLMAIPVLGQIPTAAELASAVIVALGVYLASGARLGRRG